MYSKRVRHAASSSFNLLIVAASMATWKWKWQPERTRKKTRVRARTRLAPNPSPYAAVAAWLVPGFRNFIKSKLIELPLGLCAGWVFDLENEVTVRQPYGNCSRGGSGRVRSWPLKLRRRRKEWQGARFLSRFGFQRNIIWIRGGYALLMRCQATRALKYATIMAAMGA